MKNKKKNSDYCWENVFISPITDEQGRITHFVGVKEDITEKKEIMEKLIKAKEAAEESDRLKTAFLHNISHEIRTPLNAIVGFSSFLNDPDLTDEKRKMYSDVITASNDQLLSIIDGIMRLSHLETGQVTIKEAGTDIKKMTENLFNQFQPLASDKKLGFSLNNEALDEGTIVLTDEGKLKQIISNLLENAFKFTSAGYVEFGYHINEKSLEFFIRDTGIGIHESEHEKIFNRFYQVDKSKSQIYGGTGLGLSICEGYAGLLGGIIKVNSKPGNGSVFTLILPYRPINKG
jgi:signal transduction histidine kinase